MKSLERHRRLCVAPMLDYTDRHFRYLLRLLTRNAMLYTEMVTTGALLYGKAGRFLAQHELEYPVALQLGGSDPDHMARCARLGEQAGFAEININAGCPSNRVRSGQFGACLMHQPQRVANCVTAMIDATRLPVTVKTRLGVDHRDNYAFLAGFVERIAAAGCRTVILHARKAWLQGLSPKQNRAVPPLHYSRVYRLKSEFPQLQIVINGGIDSLDAAMDHLARVDGAMLGRAVVRDPFCLAEADRRIYGESAAAASRQQVLQQYLCYMERELVRGTSLKQMSRHLLGLFQGQPGARAWRRSISENTYRPGAGAEVIRRAARYVLPQCA